MDDRTGMTPAVNATASTAAASTAAASCPDCGRTINLVPRSRRGQRVICRHCGADLELVSLEPPELDWVTSEFEAGCWLDDQMGVSPSIGHRWA